MENRSSTPRSCRPGSCFNAATASRPWRTLTSLPFALTFKGFNAATASRPWRTRFGNGCTLLYRWQLQCGHGLSAVENPVAAHVPAHPVPASMRPRPLGRGELVGAVPELTATARLQCGHGLSAVENCGTGPTRRRGPPLGFNAATASRPWRTRRRWFALTNPSALQCGHGLSAVENVLQHLIPLGRVGGFNAATASRPWRTRAGSEGGAPGPVASMRPRPLGRGEPACHFDPPPPAAGASMRPRPLGRGERWPATT